MQSLFFPCMKERDKRDSARRVVFPPIWGEKMAAFRACACKLSWTLLFDRPGQPLYGAGRKESSGTGLRANSFRNRALAQALKNLRVSRVQHQPPRVTRTGWILATIVAHFQCVSHPLGKFSFF